MDVRSNSHSLSVCGCQSLSVSKCHSVSGYQSVTVSRWLSVTVFAVCSGRTESSVSLRWIDRCQHNIQRNLATHHWIFDRRQKPTARYQRFDSEPIIDYYTTPYIALDVMQHWQISKVHLLVSALSIYALLMETKTSDTEESLVVAAQIWSMPTNWESFAKSVFFNQSILCQWSIHQMSRSILLRYSQWLTWPRNDSDLKAIAEKMFVWSAHLFPSSSFSFVFREEEWRAKRRRRRWSSARRGFDSAAQSCSFECSCDRISAAHHHRRIRRGVMTIHYDTKSSQ